MSTRVALFIAYSLFCALSIHPPAALAEQEQPSYTVLPIICGEYPDIVCGEIRSARKSIKVVMYSLSKGRYKKNPMRKIIDELIMAAQRGVEVAVIAEQPAIPAGNSYSINSESLSYLKDHGIDAYFDSPAHKTHDKFVLIDDRTLIIGNHNWSRTAMTKNGEASILVQSVPADPSFRSYFDSIKAQCTPIPGREDPGSRDMVEIDENNIPFYF